jgi:S-adenosylmethionine uptake transporter
VHNRAPAFWILVSCLLFATLSALVKVAAAGVSLPEIVFFRTLPAAVGLIALARMRGQRIATANGKLHAMRSAVGVMTMFVGFYAVSKLPLATATTIEYTTPLFMLAYLVVLARSRLTPQIALAMLGGFAGVLVLLRPTLDTGQSLAFAAALCSAALAGVVYVLIRRLSEAGEPAWRIVLWNSVSGTVVAAALIPFGPPSHYSAQSIAALAAVGIVGLGAQLSMTRAFSTGPATLLASLQYSTVAFAALYGVVLWGDVLSATSVFGLALIVLSGIVALRRADKPMPVES